MRPVSVSILVALALGLLSGGALADVIFLNGNELPLTGTIIEDDPGHDFLVFRIKGLREGSEFHVSRSRIARYWREENDYWDYVTAERERKETLERIRNGPASGTAGEARVVPPPGQAARTGEKVRADLLARSKARVASFFPDHPVLRLLLVVVAFLALSGLLYVGSRVADLPRLRFGRAALLALVTLFFITFGVIAPGQIVAEERLPLLISAEIVTWVLLSRFLGGGTISRSLLLFSFIVASIFVLGGSLFSLLVSI